MIVRAVVRVELRDNGDGSFTVVEISSVRGGKKSVVDDDGWMLRPGYRLSVSMDLENTGEGIKVTSSRRRVRRKFRPPSPVTEDGTTSSWEDSE